MAKLGFHGLSPALCAYLLTVMVVGPVAVALVAAANRSPVTATEVLAAVLLTGFATVADRCRFHLTHKINVDVATAAYIAMMLTLPTALPGVLTLIAFSAGEWLRRRQSRAEPVEVLFNLGQTALCVIAGSLAFSGARSLVGADSGWVGEAEWLAAVVAGSAAMYAVNTALVAMVAAVSMGLNPVRVWWQSLGYDLTGHATLTALGVLTAHLIVTGPALLPVLAIPLGLVQRALRDSVRLRADTHGALASLIEVIELRDPYTAGHSHRVAATARALAIRLGLTAEEADIIESAGRVHDLGKVAVDPAVLNKQGKLDDLDWAQMRLHPVHGALVIARFTAYGDGHRMVRHHHEAWDGSGYPDGLAGEAIPLGARILAVADTFDALTSDRPYRPGMGRDRALMILNQGAGSQWDPEVVIALMTHLGDRTTETVQERIPALAVATG